MSSEPTSRDDAQEVHAILVPGYWLGGWAWDHVEPSLAAAGIIAHAVTLPGLDGGDTEGLVLADHIKSIVELSAGLEGRIVLVGHSGGAAVVQGAIDARPARFARVIYVDSGPLVAGAVLRPGVVEDVALPSWDQLAAEHSSVEGMDDAALNQFRERAVAHPAGVACSPIELKDDRRFEIPATVVCTSIPSADLKQMIAAGHIPSELQSVHDVRYLDLPTGHWPMFSRPADLSRLLVEEILP